jgi:hypothetical protein
MKSIKPAICLVLLSSFVLTGFSKLVVRYPITLFSADSEATRRNHMPKVRLAKALHFEIGKTTRGAFEAWVKSQQGRCVSESENQLLCKGKFFRASSASLWAEFDDSGTLTGLKGLQTFNDPQMAIVFYRHLEFEMKNANPHAPIIKHGIDSKDLERSLLTQASAQTDLQEFQATLRVTNLGNRFAVSESYRGVTSF